MEYLLPLISVAIALYFISKVKRPNSNLNKINETNYLYNGKLISFDDDTPLLRLEQDMEDNRIYREYERNKLTSDRNHIGQMFLSTIDFIRKHPNIISTENTYFRKEEIKERYIKYVNKCKKLDEILVLDEDEFIINQNNLIFCGTIKNPSYFGQIYHIHNDRTAKYKGDTTKLLEEEFKSKWY